MKESFYFPHDYNARNDEKIVKLIRLKGAIGYGHYWMIIEMLYEAGGVMRLDCDGIGYALRTHCDDVKDLLYNYDLFELNDTHFTSKRVQENLRKRVEKSEIGRVSALKRWVPIANPLGSSCEPNAIKERKRKDIKALSDLFELVWSQYPSKIGKKAAMRHFNASIKTEQDQKDILIALENYTQSDVVVKKGYIQNGSTWFNNWHDWIINPIVKTQDQIDAEADKAFGLKKKG